MVNFSEMARLNSARLKGVIRNQDFSDTPKKLEGMDMSSDPRGQILSLGSFCVGIVTGAEDDYQFRGFRLVAFP